MEESASFEELAVPLLGPLYRYARCLTRNATEAEDLVQEAYLKALRGFAGFCAATLSQRSVKRTTPTPRFWSVVRRSDNVPGPYMSQASSCTPNAAPCDACAGVATNSASAATTAAPTPRNMRGP